MPPQHTAAQFYPYISPGEDFSEAVLSSCRKLCAQRSLKNLYRLAAGLGQELRRHKETPHPHDLVSTHGHRPEFSLRLRYLPLLQQLFDLRGRFRMRRPEAVPCTPVPQLEREAQQRGI